MNSLNNVSTEILVFKTNLRKKKDLRRITANIRRDSRIKRWHVDTTDIDKVLRVESEDIAAADIIQIIRKAGYVCEELPDE